MINIQFFSVAEIAEYLKISKTAAYELVRSPGFPLYKLKSRLLVNVEEFKKLVSGKKSGTNGSAGIVGQGGHAPKSKMTIKIRNNGEIEITLYTY